MTEEALNATIATVFMLVFAGVVSYYRIIGAPFFDLFFEFSLFYLPLALLLIYVGYLWKKSRKNSEPTREVNPPLKGQ
uniref:Uncharacterized protein n=1 Tax=Candidatus Methanomethylicus mesodigestus TaxID=1867258 RepID=A0A7C3NFB5_9CREN